MFLLLLTFCHALVPITRIPKTSTPPPKRITPLGSYSPTTNSFLIFGGTEETSSLDDVWKFSLNTKTWLEIAPSTPKSPIGRMNCGGFASHFETNFYVFGGGTPLGPQNDFWRLEINNEKWVELSTTNTPSPRSNFAYIDFIIDGHEMLAVFGGLQSEGRDNSLYILNMTTLEWTDLPNNGIIPPSSEGATLEYYDGCLYLLGGYNLEAFNPTSFLRYNLTSLLWEDITNPDFGYLSVYEAASAIYDNYLYVLYGWDLDLGQSSNVIMRVNLNSADYPWENYYFISEIVDIDSFGFAQVDEKVYIFSGYCTSQGTNTNSLYYFDLSSETETLISDSYYAPEHKFSSSMHLISSKIYVFGGKSEDTYYNSMDVFDTTTEGWTSLNPSGIVPSARYLHAADSEGDAIVVWGGEDSTGLLNDMFIFNALTGFWSELITVSSFTPSPAKASCLVLQIPNIYIYGGYTSSDISGELWKYDMGSNEYSKISNDYPVVYHTCIIKDDVFYVIFGSTYGDEPLSTIRAYNIKENKWSTYHDHGYSDYNSAQAIQLIIGDKVFIAGGQMWKLNPSNVVMVYNDTTLLMQDELEENPYAISFVYYKTRAYVHGGGLSLKSSLRLSLSSNLFYYIDLKDVCKNGICEVECSPGTYLQDNECLNCEPGYYAEGYGNINCTACPSGSYNGGTGATSSRQCYPCPEGKYISTEAAAYCIDCLSGMYCPVGSKTPLEIERNEVISSVQPKIYSTPSPSTEIFNYQISVGMFMLLVIFTVILSARLSRNVHKIDLYKALHNYELRKYMILDTTFIGGLFTLIFFTLALVIVGATVISYELSNIIESKALVPLAILENEVDSFTASYLNVYTSFLMYGDTCEIDNICNPNIVVNSDSIISNDISYTCQMSNDKSCKVNFYCKNCELNTGAKVTFSLNEKLSYCSGIKVNVTAASSIPKESSSILTSLSSQTNYIFIGSSPSKFYFTMTPSLFKSESSRWTNSLTGYHASNEVVPEKGSEYLSTELPITSQLKLDVYLEKSISSLYTIRYLKQNFIFLASSLLGSIFGIMGAVGGVMRSIEGVVLNNKSKMEKNSSFKNLQNNRKSLKKTIDMKNLMKRKLTEDKISVVDSDNGEIGSILSWR